MYTSYAPTAPTHILSQLKEKGWLGKYHLLLAHDVIDNAEEYEKIFSAREGHGYEIILDNGAYELGTPMPAEDLHDAAMIVGAKYIALPDKLKDWEATIDLAEAGAHAFRRIDKQPPYGMLAIPQGNSMAEFTGCIRALQGLFNVQAWGIPRVVGDAIGTRETAVQWVTALTPRLPIHLLGFTNDFRDDIVCCRIRGVVGIDSTEPIRLGLEGKELNLTEPISPGPRGDFWTEEVEINNQVIKNIQIMDKLLNGNIASKDLQRPTS